METTSQPSLAEISGSARLTATEYESLRAESAQARDAQQAILQWSIGALTIAFIGGLITAQASGRGGSIGQTDFVRLVIYGLAIPGGAYGAALAWLGELLRMARVGFYLRGRERSTWPPEATRVREVPKDRVQDPLGYPLLWENFIAFSEESAGVRKQQIGYAGGAGIYIGSILVSAVLFVATARAHRFSTPTLTRVAHDLSFAWALLVLLTTVTTFFLVIRRVRAIAAGAAGIEFD